MGLFDKLFGRKKPVAPSTSEVARERLTLMLVHDRLKLTPDLLERIKEELLAVISKYVEIEESGVDVELTHTEHSDKLIARMPVRRQRLPFQRDVLEPGMGNPLAAAAALAKIHQPADGAAPTENAGTAPAQAIDGPPATAVSAAPATEATPEANQSPPDAAPAASVPATPEPASLPGEAAPPAAATPAAPESVASAAADSQAAATAQEAPGSPAGASVAPGDAAGPATPAAPAGGAAPSETPASAVTPTKG